MQPLTGDEFERRARQVARAIWDAGPGDGAPSVVDGKERDCIIETPDVTYYVECTIQRSLQKLKDDAGKMVAFKQKEERRNRLVKLFFVTQEEPTAEQVEYGKARSITVLSLQEFAKRLIDGSQYLNLRVQYPFGSAADPSTNSNITWDLKYQTVAIHDTRDKEREITARTLAEGVTAGRTTCLLGDYGIGKSLLLREVFGELRKNFFNGDTELCPVLLNLREHWGQDDPHEALERHGKKVGLSKPQQLIRAFNAGRLVVMLDGFDEIASLAWSAGGAGIGSRLRDLRRSAVTLVRAFAAQCRGRCGMIVAGRSHYFDARTELCAALGLAESDDFVEIAEFTDEEAKAFLKARGYQTALPVWLPRRPLLLAKLAADNTLELLLASAEREPAQAWHSLLDAICEREARIHQSQLEPSAIRIILERLASVARENAGGLGPISEDQVAEVFRGVVHAYPDDKTRPLLQRLPGLSNRSSTTGDRNFIDDHMVDALRSGDVARFIVSPFVDPVAHRWHAGIGPFGASLVAVRLQDGVTATQLQNAVRQAAQRWHAPTLAADVLVSALRGLPQQEEFDVGGLTIADADIVNLDLGDTPVPVNVTFSEATIGALALGDSQPRGLFIQSAIIQDFIGCESESEVPSWVERPWVAEFDRHRITNAAIAADQSVAKSIRVLLTVLRKLYVQRGAGRKEGAFSRGLTQPLKECVPEVLEALERQHLAFVSRRNGVSIWQPLAGCRQRVNAILATGAKSNDSVVRQLLKAAPSA